MLMDYKYKDYGLYTANDFLCLLKIFCFTLGSENFFDLNTLTWESMIFFSTDRLCIWLDALFLRVELKVAASVDISLFGVLKFV
jgi:hypothetical protein